MRAWAVVIGGVDDALAVGVERIAGPAFQAGKRVTVPASGDELELGARKARHQAKFPLARCRHPPITERLRKRRMRVRWNGNQSAFDTLTQLEWTYMEPL